LAWTGTVGEPVFAGKCSASSPTHWEEPDAEGD
jgi:hypothetical protein